MAQAEILAVSKLPPMYMELLQAQYTVHQPTVVEDAQAFAQIAPRIVGIAASGESKVPASLLQQLSALKVVSVMGVGYDGVDVSAAKQRGVIVGHTPNVLNDDVADLAIALMLGIARRLPQADQFVRQGLWPKGPMPLARKMSGCRLGIIGLGRIGSAIAQRAQAFGMSIAYTGRTAKPNSPFRYLPSAKALAAEVDFLVAITPGGAQTKHLVNAEVLQALGPEGYLINVARGSVVDEEALIHALQTGQIAGAGLDVFANEPQVPEALRALPNVVLTPHMASATRQTRQAMADLAFANLQAGLQGLALVTPVPECS